MSALASLPTRALLDRARTIADAAYGRTVTFSPKVFIPLTQLCRDKCGYCTFAQPPARLVTPYLDEPQVLAIARRGIEAGCREALFTLGEAPEDRYEVARSWLDDHGFASTVEYLTHMCGLVLRETGLLPHANAGALPEQELAQLREVSASQGMMLETLVRDLPAHRDCPDKTPERRLATLDAAANARVPFTTGILVGIGETEADRVEALTVLAEIAARRGHIQEVIVQNFIPKQATAMRNWSAPPQEEYLRSIALARILLPPEVSVQAPPNLSDDFGMLLDAGINDWGGVSPVTPDHVNPERPWPALDRLREVSEARGYTLQPRLTVYPRYISSEWVSPPVMQRIDDLEALPAAATN